MINLLKRILGYHLYEIEIERPHGLYYYQEWHKSFYDVESKYPSVNCVGEIKSKNQNLLK